MPTSNSGAVFPAPGLDHPGEQHLLARGCAPMVAGRATQPRPLLMGV